MFRPLTLFTLLALLLFALPASAADLSWMNGKWTPDLRANIEKRKPNITPQQEEKIVARAGKRLGVFDIDTDAKKITITRHDKQNNLKTTKLDIISLNVKDADTVETETQREGQKRISRITWKRLPNDKLGMSRGNKPMRELVRQ